MTETVRMNPCNIIRKKRFGGELNREEIRAFVKGTVDGGFADYQIAAMLMAIVAEKTGKPLNELRFVSIREVE